MSNLKEIKIIDGVTTGMSFAKDINDNFNMLTGVTTTQVQSDWNATTGMGVILNKPTIPAAQVQSNWNAVSGLGVILNKPTIPAAQVQSDWNSMAGLSAILNKPTIPAAQVQSDWNATTGMGVILNKPNITSGGTVTQVQSDWNATTGLGEILNKPTTFTPESHTHTIANITNLQTTLDGKSATGHTHTNYSTTGHTHTIANITNLQTTLDGKSATGHTHSTLYEPIIPTSGTTKYWRGDKTWQTLDKAAVGLSDVVNAAPLNGDDIVQLIAPKVLRSTLVTLVQNGLNVNWDASQGALYRLTLSGDTTLNNPTNVVVGAIYQIEINQDNSGLWILSWGTNFKFPNGDKPIISLDSNAGDIVTIYSKSATELWVTYVQNFV